MDILDIGPEFNAALSRLRAHAENRNNWYYPIIAGSPPGDNPGYRLESGTLRIVFTWTAVDRGSGACVYRHLSISTILQRPERATFPSQILSYTVAHLLGFTGATLSGDIAVRPNPEWFIEMSSPNEPIPHVMLAERIPDAELTPPQGAMN
jgi:hypothetical protein